MTPTTKAAQAIVAYYGSGTVERISEIIGRETAAPELLAACELCEQSFSGVPLAQSDITFVLGRIRAAIRKAKGEL